MGDDVLATADIAIVGAGMVGLTTAWELAQRGFSVVVVEQRFVTFGSSGRNPGAIWLQTRRAGVELELARAGKAKYDEYTEVLGDVFDRRLLGGLFFFESEAQGKVLEAYVRERRAAGLDIQMVDRAQALEHSAILPDTALGAVYCADDAQIDTHQFVSALSSACTRAGVQIFENTAVLSTLRRGDQVIGLNTVRGTVQASGVVWATGAWAKNLQTEGLRVPMRTTRYGQAMTQPVDRGVSAIMHGPRGLHGCGALVDLKEFNAATFASPIGLEGTLEYDDTIVQNRGGSVYFGHSVDGVDSLNPHISIRATHAMISTAMDRHSSLLDQGVTGLWAGLQSETADGLPIVDRADGVFLNVGHAWGIASAPICGQVLAEVISEEPSRFGGELRLDRTSLVRQ